MTLNGNAAAIKYVCLVCGEVVETPLQRCGAWDCSLVKPRLTWAAAGSIHPRPLADDAYKTLRESERDS